MTNEQLNLLRAAFPNWPKQKGALLQVPALKLIAEVEQVKNVTLAYSWERSVLLTENVLEIYLNKAKDFELFNRLQFAKDLLCNFTVIYNSNLKQITIIRAQGGPTFKQLLHSALVQKVDPVWTSWLVSNDFSQVNLDKKIKELHDRLEEEVGGTYETYLLIVEGSGDA
jgi:hypothetical protein